ncbi:MAG TPA: hypothetical protein VKB46_26150, partial [Pyrinomonadaceae bacterium]|nr:hypothetical protein [Pyrinomonadaceae bacterium]
MFGAVQNTRAKVFGPPGLFPRSLADACFLCRNGGWRDFLLSLQKISNFTLGLVAAAALVFSACGGARQQSVASAPSRVLTDDGGRRVSLPARVERVISLAPNLTEIVFAVDGGDRLVGDTDYCDYPEAAKQVAKVGDTLNPSL